VIGAKGVLLGWTLGVAMTGVALLPPITTGVAETIEGVWVGGRNGVGALYGEGWKNHPLHDVARIIVRNNRIHFFISSPPNYCTPHVT